MIANNRVVQLDAELLDNELLNSLSTRLNKILIDAKLPWLTKFQITYNDEIQLVLKILMYFATGFHTYGLQIQQLKYVVKSRGRLGRVLRRAFFLSSIFGDYILKKTGKFTRLHRMLSILSFANFAHFLFNGSYRTLLNRACGVSVVETANVNRNISYEFQNRQLIWNSCLEFLCFVLPLYKSSRKASKPKTLTNIPNDECWICHDTKMSDCKATNPVTASCGCQYCYYCVNKKLAQENEFYCGRCGKLVTK